jgi:transcriptional regulator with XRE-family HTH domain
MAPQARKAVSAINLEALGRELKAIRGGRPLHVVGKAAQVDPGYLSRAEKGKQKLGEASLKRLLDYFEIHGVQREELLSYLTDDLVVEWWAKYGSLVQPDLARRIGLEAVACRWEEITGDTFGLLLQRGPYAREVIKYSWEGASPVETELWLEMRVERQQRCLHREQPLHLHSLFHEDALTASVDREIMIDQLEHLLKVAELPNATLQMVPRTAGRAGRLHALTERLIFPEEGVPKIVFSQGLGTQYVREPHDNHRFNHAFTRFSGLALDPTDTVTAIQARLKEIR